MVVRKSKKTNSVSVDFSGVESRVKVKEGTHTAKVVEVEKNRKKGAEFDYLSWKMEVTSGKSEGGILYYNTSLSPDSLWNLKAWLESLGVEVPDDEVDLELDEYVDLENEVIVENEEYEGKPRPKIVDFGPTDGDDDGEERETKDDNKRSKKSSRSNAKDADEDGGDAKKPSRGAKSKKEPAKLTQDEINEMSQEELEAVVEEYELEVDLEKLKVLRKMKGAVIEALDEAGKLDE